MQKMGDALKPIVNWRTSNSEKAAGDRLKVITKVSVKVNQIERACSEEK